MAKNFSKVRTDRPADSASNRATGSTSRPTGAGSAGGGLLDGNRRWYLLGAIAAVLIIVLIIGMISGGGTDTDGAKAQTVHGPTSFADGIPSGYTHDKGGAATAAVNIVQALGKADVGKADVTKIRERMIAAQPSETLVKVLDDTKRRGASASTNADLFNSVPATVTVRSLTDTTAEVSVWTIGAGWSAINATGQKAATAIWSTTDVQLVWEDNDWKVRDWKFRTGPEPEDLTAPTNNAPNIETGYYSFFIN